jgi:hypothetical protein
MWIFKKRKKNQLVMKYIWNKNDFDTHGLESKSIQRGFKKKS